ncbi:MAG TPA: asparagine synthase-related protein [Trebonia sp.]|jgi:hypothetical protein
MFFTLVVSAATPDKCAALTNRAGETDPALMPIAGSVTVTWRSADGRAAIIRWGPGPAGNAAPESFGDTIWPDPSAPGSPVRARTSLTRVDPVYAAETADAVILSDRALWAAWVADRMGGYDPAHACALLNTGYPLGGTTPWKGVRALPPAATARAVGGRLTVSAGSLSGGVAGDAGDAGDESGQRKAAAATAADVAAALTAAVAPLKETGEPVELSLTGGKDSRLIAAALVSAGIPVHARTHGFSEHPDVVIAAQVAQVLGIEHTVRTPAEPGQQTDPAARVRSAVLVADGMLSAFENVGRPDTRRSPALTAGGHGGELLRGGYAEIAAGRRPARLRAAEVLRRLTTKRIGLVRRGAAAGYLASLTPWTGAAFTRGPLPMLDDFYLVNRAGRWSAAARQAYLVRERLAQPLFDDNVVRAARAVPLPERLSGSLITSVITELSPALVDVPFAAKPARGQFPPAFDWRRQYGTEIAAFFRDYTMDFGTSGGLFDVVHRPTAERLLALPHADRGLVWTLATLACLVSGDFKNAREPSRQLPVS